MIARRRSTPVAAVLLVALSLPAAAGAQEDGRSLTRALADPQVQAGLAFLEDARNPTATLLAQLGAVVAPSGQEHERARLVAEHMRTIGLHEVRVTDAPNAVGIVPGESDRALVFVSTLDDLATVAENQRAAGGPPTIQGDRVVGPGTNTSVTTAALLAAAEAYVRSGLRPQRTLVFAAVAQEETGLVGMKALYEEYAGRADAFVDVLGDGHSISYGALGIHWWRIRAHGPGGHTLGGGLPNVNLAIARSVERILSLPEAALEDESRTRLNVAVLESGTVFNHKPESGWFSVDVRAMDPRILAAVEDRIRGILAQVQEDTGIQLEMEPFQLTPGGQIPGARESRLVRVAADVSRWLGHEPALSDAGSSNMNVAVAAGTPAIGIGGSRGGDRGQPSEWADIDGMMRAARHVFLQAAVLASGEVG